MQIQTFRPPGSRPARTLAADVYREIGVEIDWVISKGEEVQDPATRAHVRRAARADSRDLLSQTQS